ncbi:MULTISPECIES: nutrient deprivation-induced protein [unclassified Sinorhizobium]|uniref:nutrient deprivation-induced protein n=1 Tax=unclassified Sinorhizobium TaxID=2613772 RepID=UPI003523C07A
MTRENQTSTDLQREIDADRVRIEEKLHAIQERMSAGQMIDELIAYARDSGGADYLRNLGSALKTNPIPVALMGVSMAWLMANPGKGSAGGEPSAADKAEEYPLATITGSVRRVSPVQEDFGQRYSHFTDEAGSRFRALTDEMGRRAGHFVDQSGKIYRGFADTTGKQVQDIRDEAGTLFDEASGWAAASWRQLSSSADKLQTTVADTGRKLAEGSMTAGRTVRDQSVRLNETLSKLFHDQPLVGGALAFAAGAAVGATLPHTPSEDEAMGEASDAIRGSVAAKAGEAVDQASSVAADVYEKAGAVVSDVHDAAKERIVEEAQTYQRTDDSKQPTSRQH